MRNLRSSLLRGEIKKIIPSHPRLIAPAYVLVAAILMLLLAMGSSTALAGSATWNLNPTSGDWNTATNWMPPTVPNGPTDTATFGVSNITGISIMSDGPVTEVNGIVFDPGASAYTITISRGSPFVLSGVGITNNSGSLQNFSAGAFLSNLGRISFTNNATAGA